MSLFWRLCYTLYISIDNKIKKVLGNELQEGADGSETVVVCLVFFGKIIKGYVAANE